MYPMNYKNTKKYRPLRALLLASVLLLAVLLSACGAAPSQGRLLLKVNPEIAIDYNEDGKVLAVQGENTQGKAIVEEYQDFIGKPSGQVVSDLVEIIQDHGYLTPTIEEGPREITLSVTEDSVLPQEDFLENIAQEITSTTGALEVQPTVTVVGQDGQALSPNASKPLTKEEALGFALAHAGASEKDISHLDIDREDHHYDIDFVLGGTAYDYDVDRISGEILSFSSKLWDKEEKLQSGASQYRSIAEIKDIIAQDINAALEDITFAKIELELDDSITYYEVEVYHDGTEYDYDIDAYSGEILAKDMDHQRKENNTPSNDNASTQKENAATTPKKSGETLTMDEAKNIVLRHAGLSSEQVFFEEVKLDRDDGRLEYELEFHSGGIEYEYDIDAITGEILSVEKDNDDKYHTKKQQSTKTPDKASRSQDSGTAASSSSKSSEKSLISLDRAVNIALKHAGYSANQVRFDDRELDWDDGHPIYEIEFEVGDLEYEYDIDGYTGAILEYEIDD